MPKARSAVSKAFAKKKSQGPTQHVSGLSTAKSSSKRKAEGVKFGSLSRKQKQDLKDYGQLVPDDFQDDEDDDENLGGQRKHRRVVYEEDLDRDLEEERERKERAFDLSDEDEGDEDDQDVDEEEQDWQQASAYSRLIGSLRKTSKNREFYETIKREQEGLEEEAEYEDEDEDEEVDEALGDQDEELEGEEEYLEVPDDAKEELEDDNEDEVSEPEIAVDDESSDDDQEQIADAYVTHFADNQPEDFIEKIAAVTEKKWMAQPFYDDVLKESISYSVTPNESAQATGHIDDLRSVAVKERVAKHWAKANEDYADEKRPFTPLQERLFSYVNGYKDVFYCDRTVENAKEIRNMYMLHVMNHIQKAQDRVMKNNAKISKAQKEGKDIGELRDQGFTRPKVLIVLPFRNTVVDIVDTLIALSGTEQQLNKKRFYSEYTLLEPEEENSHKPLDFLETFKGNIDDHFRLAIKFTKKSMRFYTDFYNADLIIASPLGLRTLGADDTDKTSGYDALSSLEVVIFDQANHFLMQNWDHVEHVFQHLNLIPKQDHGCDISRIKSWYLDGRSKYLRQTLVFSDLCSPEMNAMFNKHFLNTAGKLKIKQKILEGSIVDVIPQVQQTFTRIDTTSITAMRDARFNYFIEKTLPKLRRSATMQNHTLIFIPSYFDFVRVRNYMKDNMYSFEPCCEYTSSSGIGRARVQFFHGRTDFILYTERIHFFRRFNIRGTFHVVFYDLPEHPQFYKEVVDFLGLKFDEASAAEEATVSCTALFSRYDQLKLERIVGTERAQKMCTAQKNVFMFS